MTADLIRALERCENAIYNIGGEHVTDLQQAMEAAEDAGRVLAAHRAQTPAERGELPPLPPVTWPRNVGVPSWTAEEVQAYARAAIRAAQRQAERDNAAFERGYQHGRQQERQILAAQPVATLPAQEAPAAVPMCSEQAVLHALTMARSETHQQGDAALWQAFGRAMWRQFNAMAAAAQAPAEGDARAQCDGGTCGIGGYCANCPAVSDAESTAPELERSVLVQHLRSDYEWLRDEYGLHIASIRGAIDALTQEDSHG